MPASLPRNLITGGSVFLGSHLVERLMAAGEEVIRHDLTEPIRLEVGRTWHLAFPASPVHYQFNPINLGSPGEFTLRQAISQSSS